MKKVWIYLSVIVILFAALYIINQQTEKKKNEGVDEIAQSLYKTSPANLNPLTRDQLKNEHYQDIITQDELDKRIANKDSFFAYYFSPACSHCVATTPKLSPIVKDLNVDWAQFNLLEYQNGYAKYGIEYTPTLVYYEDGVEVDRLVGEIATSNSSYTAEMAKSWLEQHAPGS